LHTVLFHEQDYAVASTKLRDTCNIHCYVSYCAAEKLQRYGFARAAFPNVLDLEFDQCEDRAVSAGGSPFRPGSDSFTDNHHFRLFR
jgi:hypothetical protein